MCIFRAHHVLLAAVTQKPWRFIVKKYIMLGLLALVPALTMKSSAATQNIVQIASGNPDFSTLVTALKAADLVKTLEGDGPFTVFAPTNKAFAKIKKADLDALLADKAALTKVLTYHVVSGKVMAADVMKMNKQMAKTVEGSELKISVMGKTVRINNAKVTAVDIEASNGVIHVIDTVLMPKMMK
jgi:uncharacterized surface protein with fasciclin (FAS1) repeats